VSQTLLYFSKFWVYAFLRGANWNNGSNAGVFTLNLNNTPDNSSNNNIGFRCALSPKQLSTLASFLHLMILSSAKTEPYNYQPKTSLPLQETKKAKE